MHSDAMASLTLPGGRGLHIRTELEAREEGEGGGNAAARLVAASAATKNEGRDLVGTDRTGTPSNERSGAFDPLFAGCRSVQGGWTGGSIWESGEVLARVLVSWSDELVTGKRVLELGTGCGLVGRSG